MKFHGDSNLMKFIDDNLHDVWTQLDENCFALLSIGEQFVDSLGELGSDEAVYQTTIAWINDRWELIEFGTKIGNAEVREKIQNATPTTLLLTLVYKERCAPEQLGFEYLHEDAVSREFFGTGDALAQGRGEQKSVSSSSSGHVVAAPEISVLPVSSASNIADTAGLDASMNEAEEESRQQELQVSGEAQNQDSAGAPVIVSDGGKDEKEEEDADVVISVNGVELRATNSLKDLREACRHYEIGTSGGKAVVFKRLVRHQKKMSQPAVVPAAENAGDSLSAPSAPKTLPVPKEPSAGEKALHELTHMPFKPWCTICQAHRSREDRHVFKKVKEETMPTISFDFCFTSRHTAAKLCALVRMFLQGSGRATKVKPGLCLVVGSAKLGIKTCIACQHLQVD